MNKKKYAKKALSFLAILLTMTVFVLNPGNMVPLMRAPHVEASDVAFPLPLGKTYNATALAYYSGGSRHESFLYTYTNLKNQGYDENCLVDIAAPKGTPIYAVADGKVSINKWANYSGNYLVIKHNDGSMSYYGHMENLSSYKAGAAVHKGDQIGTVGKTGLATGYHLHFEWSGHDPFCEYEALGYVRATAAAVDRPHTHPKANGVIGHLDYCYGGEGTFRYAGWAIDQSNKNTPVEILVYMNDKLYIGSTADRNRPDVYNVYGVSACGFDDTIDVGIDSGEKKIDIYARPYKGGEKKLLGSQKITITKRVIYADEIEISKKTLSLDVGKSATLTAKITPSSADVKTTRWESLNPEIATINNGVVKAVAPGKATIRVSLANITPNSKKWRDECVVTVKSPTVYAENISLSKTSLELSVGDKKKITATVSPSDATNKTCSWRSDNASVATVSNGEITAVGAGTANITAYIKASDSEIKASCSVTVKETNTGVQVPVTDMRVSKNELNLKVGESETVIATVIPENATNKRVVWTTDDSSIATVSNGTIKAVSPGRTRITVYSTDVTISTNECWIYVNVEAAANHVTDLSLSQSELTIFRGHTADLYASISPSNATNTGVSWYSENTSVANVKNGKVYGVGIGDARIVATSMDSGITAICVVHVMEEEIPVTGVGIYGPKNFTAHVGDVMYMDIYINPCNATNRRANFKSSDEDVALIFDGQWVMATGVGEADLTVTTMDGGHTYTRTITVLPGE